MINAQSYIYIYIYIYMKLKLKFKDEGKTRVLRRKKTNNRRIYYIFPN